MSARKLGVCYYPEHWPEEMWAEDAAEMAAVGIEFVRIGEFAWSRIEFEPGELTLDWLDRAIDALSGAGLRVILGTPTATPPRWMAEKHPDMFACDEEGLTRGFGSRRHYCFSHEGYRTESRRITEILAKRYGQHDGVSGWQTDNEYGCHETTLSYSDAARCAFRAWLCKKYGTIRALNEAWGNVFWSMEYRSFDEVELPVRAVTEVNPSHHMDFRRFSSDQVVSFNREQVDIIRAHSPGRDIVHNFMGRETTFDHYEVGADLDVSSWDSYPVGFLYRSGADKEEIARQFRQGDPDFQAFHHDLYRATGKGRFWVMEQQPGPVNWAPHNAAPLDGMVRLWSWEAFAHGAEVVSYFRWRQPRFAQEQMHAGLKRPDNVDARGMVEARQVRDELRTIGPFAPEQAPVALIFDFQSQWASEVQPQGAGYDYFQLIFETYRAFREKGLDVEIVSPEVNDLQQFKIVAAPGIFAWSGALRSALKSFEGTVLLGPRSGDKDENFHITTPMPPAIECLPGLCVSRVETLPADVGVRVQNFGDLKVWREFVEGPQDVVWRGADGHPVLLREGHAHYLAGWPDAALWSALVDRLADDASLSASSLPSGIRTRKTTTGWFVFNYGQDAVPLDRIGLPGEPELLVGDKLRPADIAFLKNTSAD